MIDTRVVSQELQDKIFDQVRKGQEQVRKGQETVAEAIKSWTATAQSIAPQMSDLPSWTARLPKPEELVANAHDLAGQLLAAQKKSSEQLIAAQKRFAEQARDAVAPLLALAGVSSARPVSKPASVSTTGTSTAKASTPKASTARTSTAKASTARTSTAKASTATKAGAPRSASAAKKASTPRKSAAAKQAAADNK
jgi:hypothetical protein